MPFRIYYGGGNFTGRSAAVQAALKDREAPRQSAYLGPFAETCLSGFAITPQDELRLYGQQVPSGPWRGLFQDKKHQSISTLSGGEQVMLALTVLAGRQTIDWVGLDCALEQLDSQNRILALELLNNHVREAIHLVDHRLRPDDWGTHETRLPDLTPKRSYTFGQTVADESSKATLFASLTNNNDNEEAPTSGAINGTSPSIELKGLCFSYAKAAPVFENCNLLLEPGRIFRLFGANGAGKSTFFKLICGLLKPQTGGFLVNDIEYKPFVCGNRLAAYAMQNPDEQWIATSLQEDLKIRLRRQNQPFHEAQQSLWASYFRLFDIDLEQNTHVLDYPRAQRKRLSWYWALSGIMPWTVLDEPTIGQDTDTVAALAERILCLSKAGRGAIIVSHDERLIETLRPVNLQIVDRKIITENSR